MTVLKWKACLQPQCLQYQTSDPTNTCCLVSTNRVTCYSYYFCNIFGLVLFCSLLLVILVECFLFGYLAIYVIRGVFNYCYLLIINYFYCSLAILVLTPSLIFSIVNYVLLITIYLLLITIYLIFISINVFAISINVFVTTKG